MLENRSFDHLLGFVSLGGTDAVTGSPTEVDGLAGKQLSNVYDGHRYEASTGAPFALDVDPGHSFKDVLEQVAGPGSQYLPGRYPNPAMTGFAGNFAAYSPKAGIGRILECFTEAQLPALTTLAREFAVCDRWFSSLPGPTMPNRFFVHAASSGGLDDSPNLADMAEQVLTQGFSFEHKTIFHMLSRHHVPWTVWEGDELPTALLLSGMVPQDLDEEIGTASHFRDFDDFQGAVKDPGFPPGYNFIEPSYGELFFGQHMKCGTSMHPVDDVTRGDGLVKTVYDSIRDSPHWENSLLVVMFDEHGGFFDHVPPESGIPPGDRPQSPGLNKNGFQFEQLGVRVPTVVVSPWIPKGTIDHRLYDHSAVPRTLEDVFELDESLTARDKAATSLSGLLSLKESRTDRPVLPSPAKSDMRGCDDGILEWLERIADGLASSFGRHEAPTSVTQTFLHAAIRRESEMSGLQAARAMAAEARNVKSQHEAAAYIHHTRLKYRGFKAARRA